MQGGNFIDTANNYQFEESETWIGEWMKKRGVRDQMVVATKYTTNFRGGPNHPHVMANFTGNGSKSMHVSVEASLKKLQTGYIDLLYVHWFDYSTGIPELMQSLNQLVLSGKVLYLGISDTPAWVVSKANEYARNHGLRQFSVYQGLWSASNRDFERDIIPMCHAEGMGLAPWGALGGGKFKSSEQRQAQASRTREGRNVEASDREIKISEVLESIAKRKNTVITSIALSYVMHKSPYVFPIVGGRKVEHLKGNIEALSLQLDPEDIKEIESAAPFDLGFPHSMLWGTKVPENPQQVKLLAMGGTFDYVDHAKASKKEAGELGSEMGSNCLDVVLSTPEYASKMQRAAEVPNSLEVVQDTPLTEEPADAPSDNLIVPSHPTAPVLGAESIPETPDESLLEHVQPLSKGNNDSVVYDVLVSWPGHGSSPRQEEKIEEIHQPPETPAPSKPRSKLKPLPRHAPRSIERKGLYIFRSGVRIRDYKVPNVIRHFHDLQFRCRDGFDLAERLGMPRPMWRPT
ncbi:Norsolorinic acid reductase A [Paramyrothecium foliicola]|nr:Norsolorinic acid reductase A [Paramyrothecium foliicola]